METVAVVVRDTQQRKLCIISGYTPPSTTLRKTDLTTIFENKIPKVLLGDLNAKHTAWRCSRNNRAGNVLLDFCINHGVNIYAPDHATYVNTRGQENVLDLALGYDCYLSQPHSVPCMSSDHNPVVCKIRFTPQAKEKRYHFDYGKANWNDYKQHLDARLPGIPQLKDEREITQAIHKFTSAVLSAATATIPMRTYTARHLQIPAPIENLIKIRNYVRRRF